MQKLPTQQQQDQPSPAEQREQAPVAARRSWRRPTLQRLHASLDTAENSGSGADAANSTDALD